MLRRCNHEGRGSRLEPLAQIGCDCPHQRGVARIELHQMAVRLDRRRAAQADSARGIADIGAVRL